MLGVVRLTYTFISTNPFGYIMLLELFLVSLAFGFTFTWFSMNLFKPEDLDFVIFDSSQELQEVCWKGLRHGEK